MNLVLKNNFDVLTILTNLCKFRWMLTIFQNVFHSYLVFEHFRKIKKKKPILKNECLNKLLIMQCNKEKLPEIEKKTTEKFVSNDDHHNDSGFILKIHFFFIKVL